MARKKHLINVHTSTGTTAPTGASLYLGEIAVQHTPNDPGLWIKMGTEETSTEYEKFIGKTEITNLINQSKILGSGYTYSGLPYVNSATTLADAYSALTKELLDDEVVVGGALNDLNDRVNIISAATGDNTEIIEYLQENEEVVAGALNSLNERIGTVETHLTGDYIPITGYMTASGSTEEELTLNDGDTVNEALGKLQKQMLDNEEAIAAGLNDLNTRLENVDELIAHNTGVTQLSGAVRTLSAATEALSAATNAGFGEMYQYVDDGLNALSAGTVHDIAAVSAKTAGILTVNVNGTEQGKYCPSASTSIDLEIIQEVTGADVLLTGYALATGSTEEELAIVASDTVNEAFGKIQKQNYDNEAVVAGALNDLDERITTIEISGASAEDIEVLSGIAEDHEERLDVLEISAATNNDLLILSGVVIDDELVTAHALIELDKKIASAATADDVLELSGAVQVKDFVVAAALNDLNSRIVELSGNTDVVEPLSAATIALSAGTVAAIADLEDKIDELSANTDVTVLQEITWSELKTLRDSSGLTPGMQYRITDYNTTTSQEDTQAAGHQFDIIVVADDVNKLNENARAVLHNGDTYFSTSGANLNAWEIKYSLDNDDKRFYWAVTGSTGRGVIYYMKDEWNNECPYDFKNIKFPRYKITACQKSPDLEGLYSVDGISDITVDTSTTYWCYTFSMINNFEDVIDDVSVFQRKYIADEGYYYLTHDNVFKKRVEGNSEEGTQLMMLPNNVFVTDTDICAIEEDYSYGEFYGFYSNTFGNSCNYNTFGNYCNNNTFGNDFRYNTFGNSCNYNTFGNSCGSNTFGNDCYYNTFGNSFYSNTFGNNCYDNTFGNECYYNTFGNNCYRNTFGNNCYHNTFGNDCGSNTFGNNFGYNTFGNYCNNNTFGNDCQQIRVQKDYVYYIIVENGNKYITITSTKTTSSSNILRNFTISQGVNNGTSESSRKTISHNTLNDEFKTTYQSTNSQVINI